MSNREKIHLTESERIRRLTLPEGRLDIVLDTDTYNEVDDQFALAYALLSPDRLNVQAIYAAPFYNDRSSGPADGMQRSYDEILRFLSKLSISADGLVYKGSDSYLPGADIPVDSPAARDLVARAMARPEGDLLNVIAIGAITNVASALLMEPRIAEKIAIIWLGGHPTTYPNTYEFNLSQDVPAARVVLDSGAPVTLVPCLQVASHMLTTVAELESCIGGKNDLCDSLIENVRGFTSNHFGCAKEIWDVATIGYMIDPGCLPSKLVHSPLLTDDFRWAHDESRHFIRECVCCFRNPIFTDMFEKLSKVRDQ